MGVATFSKFGKKVKKRLVDIDRNQNWLIDRVKEKTGLYCDSSYMYKILTGQHNTPSIVQAICEILGIESDPTDGAPETEEVS